MTTELKELLKRLTTGDSPHVELKAARKDGSLARLIPELDVLYGIPQTAEYHPEVDTGIHIEMVLEVAARLTSNPRVRFAALVHDFGKGITPAHEWPKHLEHEEMGVPVVEQFCERAGVPADWQRLGVATSRWHLFPHRIFTARPGTIVKLLVESGFIDEPDLFDDFLMACEADKRGRGGLMDSDYPQRPFLQKAMVIVKGAGPVAQAKEDEDPLRLGRCQALNPLVRSIQP